MPDVQVRILLVDDDEPFRAALCEMCADSGYSVRDAEDGFSALAAMRREIPDVVISDLNMPGMSGFEYLSVIRRRFPAIRVIAMSGAFSGSGVPPGVAADAYYEKGTPPDSLLQIVEAMIESSRPSFHQPASELAAVWIPRNGDNLAGKPYVVVTCTECLRSFPHVPGTQSDALCELECVFCGCRIRYAIVQPSDLAMPQAFQRKPGTGAPSPLCLADFSL